MEEREITRENLDDLPTNPTAYEAAKEEIESGIPWYVIEPNGQKHRLTVRNDEIVPED